MLSRTFKVAGDNPRGERGFDRDIRLTVTRTTPFGWSPRLIDRGVYDEMVCDAGDLEEGPNEHSWGGSGAWAMIGNL